MMLQVLMAAFTVVGWDGNVTIVENLSPPQCEIMRENNSQVRKASALGCYQYSENETSMDGFKRFDHGFYTKSFKTIDGQQLPPNFKWVAEKPVEPKGVGILVDYNDYNGKISSKREPDLKTCKYDEFRNSSLDPNTIAYCFAFDHEPTKEEIDYVANRWGNGVKKEFAARGRLR